MDNFCNSADTMVIRFYRIQFGGIYSYSFSNCGNCANSKINSRQKGALT